MNLLQSGHTGMNASRISSRDSYYKKRIFNAILGIDNVSQVWYNNTRIQTVYDAYKNPKHHNQTSEESKQ